MRNKVSSEIRLESSTSCRKCGATTIEIVNNPPSEKDKLTLKCTNCGRKITGNNISLLMIEWDESNNIK